MDKTSEFQPNWSSAPGETIVDILQERGVPESTFSGQMCFSAQQTADLLEGRSTITIGVARKLSKVLGASVEFWMARDHQYRQDSRRLEHEDRQWVRSLPLADMVKFGWLTPAPLPTEEFEACLDFFGVTSIRQWSEQYFGQMQTAAFRTSPTFVSRYGADAAWLRQGELQALEIECQPWNPEGFLESLVEIRKLTRLSDPANFLPKLNRICSMNGVAVVVVRAPTGCRASGATRFITAKKAILQLSFRFLSDDQFWFTLFHEAGHILLHGERRYFSSGLDRQESWILEGQDVTQDDNEEREANEFAENVLVPKEFREELPSLSLDYRSVVRFAARVGVSPGIIVGQLQHAKHIGFNRLNHLKRRYQWDG